LTGSPETAFGLTLPVGINPGLSLGVGTRLSLGVDKGFPFDIELPSSVEPFLLLSIELMLSSSLEVLLPLSFEPVRVDPMLRLSFSLLVVLVLSAFCVVVAFCVVGAFWVVCDIMVDVVVVLVLRALPSSEAGVAATLVKLPEGTVLFKQFPLSAKVYAGSGVQPRGFLIV